MHWDAQQTQSNAHLVNNQEVIMKKRIKKAKCRAVSPLDKVLSTIKTAILILFIEILLLMAGAYSLASNVNVLCVTNTLGESSELMEEEPLSQDYEVWFNGIKTVVYVARVQDPPWEKERTKLDFGGNYSFTSFDITKPVEVKILSKNKMLNNTVFRPDNAKLKKLVKRDHEITFTINKPIKLSIEPDGKKGPLLLFINEKEVYIPDKNDKNVIWFSPGIHRPDSMIVRVRDNQTLYLAEGAIVKAGVIVSGNNAKVCGRGILCGNEFIWGKGARNMVLIRGNNVTVKDIIIRGPATWTIPIRNCNNIVIDNVKILGGRAQNDDGINPVNAQDVLIRNCFIRTDDDCIALKGMQNPLNNKNVERIRVENSILWCDRARIFLLGHESRAEYMKDLTFRNIDIIHFSMIAFLLEPGEEMKLQDAIFENFRIYGEGEKELIRLKPSVNQYMRNKVPGYISNITFKKISVTGLEGPYKIQLMGADEKHNVNGVTLSGISILGERIKTESSYLQIENFVNGLVIK